MSTRPTTPPPKPTNTATSTAPSIPLTPEQVRRIEENRLKAKALRARQEAAAPPVTRTPSGYITGQKRPLSATVVATGPNQRDARQAPASTAAAAAAGAGPARPHDDIQTARRFTNYVEYDFSKMTDTKGGFLTAEDDPHNRVLHAPGSGNPEDAKPAHMTMKEWERHQLLKKLREQRSGPFEPGLSAFAKSEGKEGGGCRECGSLEVDWKWEEVFNVRVCNACKDKIPEKYSLLTKTEARADYLLTDPELKDPDLLPHLERPNPHKASYHNMQLYLRFQVEEYAFSDRKWGSQEKMDEEFEKREAEKKKRKEEKFRGRLAELKKRTRVEAFKRARKSGAGEAQFGDRIGRALGERHEHEWGRTLVDEGGVGRKRCAECGLEVEEIEF